jgi:hypothetical protein
VSLSKRTRFEVFKRDSFTCQYCGKKSPDVVLHADHIHPKAAGGTDSIANLITACEGCNLGKAAVPLSDDSAIAKQHNQLARLQERQEQIEMMMQWQRSLMDLDKQTVDALADFWCEIANWWDVNEGGIRDIKKLARKWGHQAVMEAMRLASETYFRYPDNDATTPTSESAELGFKKLGGICSVRASSINKPYLQDMLYTRAILRNRVKEGRMSYVDERRAMTMIEDAFAAGANADRVKQIAMQESTWSAWSAEMRDYIDELCGENT